MPRFRSAPPRLFGRFPRRFALFFVALMVLTLLPVAPAVSTAAADPGTHAIQATGPFYNAPCPVSPPEGVTVDCGVLVVPESRANYTGRTVTLPVAIIRSPNPNKAADPVVFLTGGPGQGATGFVRILPFLMEPVLANRDIILMDQRGTGFSEPRLDCSFQQFATVGELNLPVGVQESERPLLIQLFTEALSACGELYRQLGVDLTAYNSTENAADFEDLRRALGVPQFNLFGGSYGVQLGLKYMQYYPGSVRSAVLDSVYAPQLRPFSVTGPETYNRSLGALFAECAADPACNAAYPDLGAAYDRMIETLNANPAQLPIINFETDEVIDYLPFTGVDAATIIFSLLYDTTAIPVLPLLISATGQGDYSLFSILVSSLFQSGDVTEDLRIGISVGMQYAVECNEQLPYSTAADFVRARDTNRRASQIANTITFNEASLDVCAAFGITGPVTPIENNAVQSDRPTLMITGALDPITPPSNAFETAANLPNSTVVVYPRGGHTPGLVSPCLTGITASFFDTPEQPVDTSCVAQEGPLPFLVLN